MGFEIPTYSDSEYFGVQDNPNPEKFKSSGSHDAKILRTPYSFRSGNSGPRVFRGPRFSQLQTPYLSGAGNNAHFRPSHSGSGTRKAQDFDESLILELRVHSGYLYFHFAVTAVEKQARGGKIYGLLATNEDQTLIHTNMDCSEKRTTDSTKPNTQTLGELFCLRSRPIVASVSDLSDFAFDAE